ncbi:MAG: trypsin-like peptidase domain-containing protein [Clostridia bacterium]|nr:trypsin-like peptidase domain-containing protein [Clostridia bacterium]
MNQQNPNGMYQNQSTGYRSASSGTTGYGYAPAGQQQQPVQYATPVAKKSGAGKVVAAIVAVLLAVGLIGAGAAALFRNGLGTAGSGGSVQNDSGTFSFNEVESPKTDTTVGSSGDLLTPAQVAAKVRPSIVSVVTVDNVNYMSSNSGEGSGIILRSDGYIVTNSHVIGDSSKYDVSVITSDGQTYDAKVVGYDVKSDLAVLKINATGLPECELGDSSQLVLGDYVVAIGNPGGRQFAGSVTMGIVSGVDRIIDTDNMESTSAMRYIQTDAAINPGNSGGALVNMYGQVIGVNTAKISASGYEGMGFAIPSVKVKEIVTDLIQYGYVEGRVKLGITCVTISSAYESQGIPAGLQIYDINPDSDMNGKAQKYDIITHCDGNRITELSQLQDIMITKKPGDTIRLTLYRPATTTSASQTFDIDVKLLKDTGAND